MESAELFFESGESSLSVRRFSVRESLSQPFEVNVIAHSDNAALPFESIVGKAAQFSLQSVADELQTRAWTGVCSHMALLRAANDGLSTYLVRIVPDLWLLSQRRGHRIFQRMTLPQIVQQLLGEWQQQPKLELTAEYAVHDFVVQYGESDLDFMSRLCERAGITYTFDFVEQTTLVLSDAPHLGEARSNQPRYHGRPPEVHGGEFVTHVRLSEAFRPGAYAVRDFDFLRRPDHALLGKAKAESFYQQYHYAPGAMLRVNPPDGGGESTPTADDKGKVRHSPKEGDALAERALGGECTGRRTVSYETNCNDLAPGCVFAMADHPRDDLKEKLLVVRSRLEGTVGQRWVYGGEAVFAAEPYLPPPRTPRPRIDGVQSALVVGPPDEEIYTDEHGRVRVQFHWDREGQRDDDSSCWMRVSQDWAGAGYGAVLLPRIGQEVLVAFLEGDPDQPLVVGRLYNEDNPVPYELPLHKTRSGWRSRSSPKSEGYNEIYFEDARDRELVYHQAERDLQKLTKREESERIGGDHTVIVGHQRKHVVKTVDATMVGKVSVRQMMAPADKSSLKILEQEAPSVSARATTVEMTAGRVLFTTGQATVAFDGATLAFDAAGDITLNAKGDDVIFESGRAFINTLTPAPAPKPGPVAPLAPATTEEVPSPVGRPQSLALIDEVYKDIPKECDYVKGDDFTVYPPADSFAARRQPYQLDQAKPVKTYYFTPEYYDRQGKYLGTPPADALSNKVTIGNKVVEIITPNEPPPAIGARPPSVEQIADSLAALPPGQLDAIDTVVANPGLSFSDNPTDSYTAEAMAWNRRVDYFSAHSEWRQYDVDQTMMHESGHAYAQTLWGTPSSAQWEEARAADGNFVSKYAQQTYEGDPALNHPKGDTSEDFAESMVMYGGSKGTPCEGFARHRYPNRYRLIEQFLGEQ